MPRQVPNFLVIGAMKAGTTTLFRDLENHPAIFIPQDKEPETLTKYGSDQRRIVREYATLFARAKPGQIRGEASTAYTKRPDHEGVAQRAMEVCGPDLKLIYLTRSPVERALSQYKHEYAWKSVNEPLNEGVLKFTRFLAYSDYEWQLEPWRRTFRTENLLVLEFEKYVCDRQRWLDVVTDFLGVGKVVIPAEQLDRSFNSSIDRKVAHGFIGSIIKSDFYRHRVKVLLPRILRESAMSALLPMGRQPPDELHPTTIDVIQERLIEKQWRKQYTATESSAE